MIYIYRQQVSAGARELATALGGQTLRRHQEGNRFATRRGGALVPIEVQAADTVVCWGATLPATLHVRLALNNAVIHSKFGDAEILTRAGVPTVTVSRTRPQATAPVLVAVTDPAVTLYEDVREAAEDFIDTPFGRTLPFSQGVEALRVTLAGLQRAMLTPAPVPRPAPAQQAEWLGRSNSHVGGEDLLTPVPAPDYYVHREALDREYRVHSFNGKSIRAGVKELREGFALGRNAHAWVRSYGGGWRVNYDSFESTKVMRELAHAAVKALGLQFGAVDIGQKADGSLIVLEVNRAPGLEGGTVDAYARAIRGLVEGTV